MKLLVIVLLLVSAIANAQFTSFDTSTVSQPTTQELLASLTVAQRSGVLNAYALGKKELWVKYKFYIPPRVTKYFYDIFGRINYSCDSLMRSGTYSQVQLRNAILNIYEDDFDQTQITNILQKKIDYSKHDGTGDWNYYNIQVKQ